jgi:hypothetical protein
MKKIVYVCYEPVTAKVERDWYINSLISRGIAVEYWDCSSIFYHQLDIPDEVVRDYVVKIKDYDHFESLLKLMDNLNTACLMLIIYEFKAYKLYRLLTRYNCRLYFIKWAVFPLKNRIVSKLVKFPSHPIKLGGRLCDKILISVTRKMGLVRPFEKVFYAGSAALPDSSGSSRSIPVNMCDYDNFKLLKDAANPLYGKDYAVFLDCNLAFHPDIRLLNAEYVDPRRYFDSLNRFFDIVQSKYGMDVIIAAHPSSNYQDDPFRGRKIVKHITPILVRDSKLVISHHSASMNFAVLNRKPLVFVYTDEMERLYSDSAMTIIKGSAEFLGAAICNLDRIAGIDEIVINEVDEEKYDLYKYSFLTSKASEKLLTQDIFYREIISN